ncbi:MAG: hypothetical protein ISS82_04700 [Nanoarchaeota archaeon]|nr:hypothetical protein [Nanoarchaeota archaeon]
MAVREETSKGYRVGISPLTYLIKGISILLGFGIGVFIITILLSFIFTEQPLLNYVYNEVTDPLINTGFGNFIKKGFTYLSIPFSAEKQAELVEESYWKSNVDINSKNDDLGVRINKFEVVINNIDSEKFLSQEGSKIEALAEGHASTIESIEIEFSCLTEDNKLGEVANQNNILSLSENRKQFFTVKCVYDKDLFDIDQNEAIDFQKIKIKSSYEFVTESYLPIYLLQKDILDLKREDNEDVFEDVDDSNLDKNKGITSSVYTEGPLKLVLRSLYTQPFTEEGPFGSGSYYTLDIRLDDNVKWTGNIEEIEEIYLLIPDEVNIVTTDFEEMNLEDGFNVYRAKASLIEKLYEQCEAKSLLEDLQNIIDEDCWRRGDMITSLEFSIDNAPEEISKTFIRAKVKYRYGDIKQDTVNFINT